MFDGGIPNNFPGLLETDALFFASKTPEAAGLTADAKSDPAIGKQIAEGRLKPGFTHYMTVCLPVKTVYTLNDCGLLQKAKDEVNKTDGPAIIPLPDKPDDNIEYMPDWGRFMVKETPPTYEEFIPNRLYIAAVDNDTDTVELDAFLAFCKEKNPGFKAFAWKGENLEPELVKTHGIESITITWNDYLDTPAFREYYQQRLLRLFKEVRRWPLVPDFTGRGRELKQLEQAVNKFNFVHVKGDVGVGKTALLARLADKASKKQAKSKLPIAWIAVDSHLISKAEILLSLAIQLGLVKSPRLLEQSDLKQFFAQLQQDIQQKLKTDEAIIVFDGFDPVFKRWSFKNEELQNLIFQWVGGGFFGSLGGLGKGTFVFTGNLNVKDPRRDPFTKLKTSLAGSVPNREQVVPVKRLSVGIQRELFFKWLAPVSKGPGFKESAERLLKLAEGNLRLLRIAALWACEAGGMAAITDHISEIEKSEPWKKETLIYKYLFKEIGDREQVILKTLEWIGRPVPSWVLCSSAGMATALERLTAEGLVIADPAADTYQAVYRFGRGYETGLSLEDESLKQAVSEEIRIYRFMGEITGEGDDSGSVDYYSNGETLCEHSGLWQEWKNAPVVNVTAFLPRAMALVREAKRTGTDPTAVKDMALQAVSYCMKSIEVGVETGNSHFWCAQALALAYPHSHNKQIDGHFKKALALESRLDILTRYAIFTYRRLKDFDKAEQRFKAVEKLDRRENITFLNAFAEFYLRWRGHEQQAGSVLDRLIKRKESRVPNLFLTGRLFQLLDLRYVTAFFFNEVLAISQDNIQVLNTFANACVQWGNKEDARKWFEKALNISPDNVQVLNSYANACVQWGEKNHAKKLFEKALKIVPDNVLVLNSYAKACAQWGEKKHAKELFEKSLDLDEKHVPTLNIYANACVQWGEKEHARELFEKSLEVDDKHVPTLNSYANACVQWREKDHAIEFFKKALRSEPNNAIVLNTYGKAIKKWGEADRGTLLLEKAKALDVHPSTNTTMIPPVVSSIYPPSMIPPEETATSTNATTTLPSNHFAFTPDEITWFTDTSIPPVSPTGSGKWAVFGILFTLFHLQGQLEAATRLGCPPALENEYRKLLKTVDRFHRLLSTTAKETPSTAAPEPVQWEEAWFQYSGPTTNRLAYFDGQMLTHPQNPACAAFLIQTLEDRGWKNIAAYIAERVLEWMPGPPDSWQPFMSKRSIDLMTPKGREAFRNFLQAQSADTAAPPGAEAVTPEAVGDIVDRFSITWHKLVPLFPWAQLTAHQQALTFTKLTDLLGQLKNALQAIVEKQPDAFQQLPPLIESCAVPSAFIRRLDRYRSETTAPKRIPLHVSGEILDITETALQLQIDLPDGTDFQQEVVKTDFPDPAPQKGRRFFAQMDRETPGTLYNIELIPLSQSQRTFDQVMESLFGKDVFAKNRDGSTGGSQTGDGS